MIIEITIPKILWYLVFPAKDNPKLETWGMVLYPFIVYRSDTVTTTLRRHEWCHIGQIRKCIRTYEGWFVGVRHWYKAWFMFRDAVGYEKIPFEVEAYEVQNDATFNPWEDEWYISGPLWVYLSVIAGLVTLGVFII